jgi:hypothetical protein
MVRWVYAMSFTDIGHWQIRVNYPSVNEYFCEFLGLRICCLIAPALTPPLRDYADDATMAVVIRIIDDCQSVTSKRYSRYGGKPS